MTASRPPGETFRVLSEPECRELLTTTTVGRVAFVDAAGIHLVPLNFAVIDDLVFFRTSPDSLLAGLPEAGEIAFGVDHHAELFRHGWNVTVKGSASRVTDPEQIRTVLATARLRPWAGGERDVVIALEPRSIEGRRVHD
ncbi:pyridoxamine 5'-phosphate oxidase family protein [Aeromicrobium marinum DSM 15272]|uniref:Pyridoxamine 5'-phosphate oxidase family protein n=1 Tax=Aeromicrobium marinum DSM 15272 TaxID=585531 RepID=E2SCJ2_9ACTN|nr:pyridoxamine 5'-phosphate oxidase family protein [Aeromicrobium marinum]EFQ82945.1 pyridoxamine 5'-phosphate oxidase family protein [Aeromicrobium marinum DSM 15272]